MRFTAKWRFQAGSPQFQAQDFPLDQISGGTQTPSLALRNVTRTERGAALTHQKRGREGHRQETSHHSLHFQECQRSLCLAPVRATANGSARQEGGCSLAKVEEDRRVPCSGFHLWHGASRSLVSLSPKARGWEPLPTTSYKSERR